MKAAKTIDVKLNGLYDARFTLEFNQDNDGNEIGILTAPSVRWLELDKPAIEENVYELSGKVLECIEKQYFNNHVVTIPVKGCPYPVAMEDFLHQVMPDKTYNQMLNGTYKIADDADKSIYGNMPSKIDKNAKPVKAGKQSKAKLIKDPSADAINDIIKSIVPEYEQIVKTKE
jgi:hypothetical protein